MKYNENKCKVMHTEANNPNVIYTPVRSELAAIDQERDLGDVPDY